MATPIAALADALGAGGETGRLIAGRDWASTPLGPMEAWPERLKAIVAVVVRSPFPLHVVWGPELRQFYNDAYRAILGSTKHPAIGEPIAETFPESFASHIEPRMAVALAGAAHAWGHDMLPINRHGWLEESHFSYCYSPLDGDDGRVAGVLTQCMEITHQVLSDRRLALLTQLGTATAAASTPEEMLAVAVDLLATCPCVPWAMVVDTADDDALVACSAGLVDPPTLLPLAAADVRAAARLRRPVRVEHLGLRTAPSEHWPRPSEAGRVVQVGTWSLVLGVHPGLVVDDAYLDFQDLVGAALVAATGRATREAEARAHLLALQQLDRAKDVFLSDVSHELRTPLSLVSGTLEELAGPAGADAAERAELLGMGRRSVDRLSRLVDSLLTFGELAAGAPAPDEACDAAAVTRRVVEVFRPEVARAGLELVVDLPHEPLAVPLPGSAWESVVSNLLSNAVKFTLEGHVEVSLRAMDDEVVLSVADTGVGIRSADLPDVFQRFYRTRGGRARSEEGAGIGLALVAGLAGRSGGRVGVASEEGVGSTFTVVVPVAALPAPTASTASTASAEEPARVDRPSPPVPVEGDRLVLVVDDNEDLRTLMRRVLGRHWRVVTARHGVEALEVARRDVPDVVVTDLMMPVMDGAGLLRELRADPALAEVPAVVLTGAGEEHLSEPADALLVKPFQLDDLVACVSEQLAGVPPGPR